ncbi:MAG: rod shape-determining protein [Planctomycetota bacterium]|jgi:rod shape-determining protein MreB
MTDQRPDTSKPKAARPDPLAEAGEDGIFWIGIDLGTSRTAIAASNGVRESTLSLVGYPRDVISRKLFGDGPLYGRDAADQRLAVDVLRPLEAGVIKGSDGKADDRDASANMRAAQDLLRHSLSLARPPKDELVYAVIGVPAEASITNRQAILEAVSKQVDSVMICSEPFAVAYGLDRLTDVLVIDIGAGTTDMCRMHGTMPGEGDQVTIDHAGDAIDRELARLIRKNHPDVSFSDRMVTEAKEAHADLDPKRAPVIVHWPVDGKPTDVDITKEMVQACHAIVPPIVEGLRQLVSTFDPEFQYRLRNNVLLGGGGSQIRGLGNAIATYMAEHLGGGRVTTVEEPVFAGANGALKIARDMPPDFWERLS